MDIKQTLRSWLANQQMDAWWSPGTREAMTEALAEIERLEALTALQVRELGEFRVLLEDCRGELASVRSGPHIGHGG
jgi:hypothetical protein